MKASIFIYDYFYSCEKDNLEQTLKKIMNKDTKNDSKNQCLFVSLKLLHGDLKQVHVC